MDGSGAATRSALLERDAELAEIDATIAAARGGDGCALVVEGQAGIGKSRLLAEAAARARREGMLVLDARGGELERDFAFGVVRQLFERHLAALSPSRRAELLGGAAEAAGPAVGVGEAASPAAAVQGSSFATLHGLYWLTLNLAEELPLALVVDDAHWADSPSLRFVAYLARRLSELPVLVVVGLRPNEPGADLGVLGEIGAGGTARKITPRALSGEAVTALVETGLDREIAEPFASACHSATAGNPFLLRELVTALRSDGVPPTAAEAERVAAIGPQTVSHAILGRVGRIPGPGAELARATAILGNQVELRHAAALAGLELENAARAADALADADVLERELPLSFTHPIVREAIYQDLPPGDRSLGHHRAARMLLDDGAAGERVAPHLLVTEPGHSAEVVEVLEAAAGSALARGAPDLAARYLSRAIAEPPPRERVGHVLADLGWAEMLVGEDEDAWDEHLTASLEHPASPQDTALRAQRFARALHARFGSPRVVDVLERAVDEVGTEDPELTLGLEVELATWGLLDERTVLQVAPRLERFIDVRGETVAECLALASLAMRRAVVCGLPAGEVTALGAPALEPDAPLSAIGNLAQPALYEGCFALIQCDAFDVVGARLDAAVAESRRLGSSFIYMSVLTVRSLLSQRRGALAEAEADARDAFEASGLNGSMVPLTGGVLADVLVERGELDAAEDVVERAGPPEALPNVVHFNYLLAARARLRAARGDLDGAASDFAELARRETAMFSRNPASGWRADAALVEHARGRVEASRALLAEQRELAEAWGTPSTLGITLRAEGLVAGDGGLELLDDAVTALQDSPRDLEMARALVDAGAARRRAGRRKDARERLERGLELARRCGATELAQRAHEELRTAGARPRRLSFSGVESLTASERRVAEMAAGGMTNREIAQALFVTPKTVENHLGRIYTKLGINARTQIADQLVAV